MALRRGFSTVGQLALQVLRFGLFAFSGLYIHHLHVNSVEEDSSPTPSQPHLKHQTMLFAYSLAKLSSLCCMKNHYPWFFS